MPKQIFLHLLIECVPKLLLLIDRLLLGSALLDTQEIAYTGKRVAAG
jgi:hypothetical protein